MNPLLAYNNLLKLGKIQQDKLQNEVVLAFEDLYNNLLSTKKLWFFQSKKMFCGLYIFGSVGRGKTFLMDLFVECVDTKPIRRQHFHPFMLWLHQQLKNTKNQQNPIDAIIKHLAKEIDVLCLDEFLVHDITDAMLLAKLLEALHKHKIHLITTSNVKPADLYAHGLQRNRFLPAIAWIQQHMLEIELDGNHDHRGQNLSTTKTWLSPINPSNQADFEQHFTQLVQSDEINSAPITINNRQVNIVKRSTHHIMIAFETLCMQPRNANDYIKICQQFQSLFIVINAPIADGDHNTARRFITLIDVLYDNKTPLYVLSAVDFRDIYHGADLAFEMRRATSRLTQMQQLLL